MNDKNFGTARQVSQLECKVINGHRVGWYRVENTYTRFDGSRHMHLEFFVKVDNTYFDFLTKDASEQFYELAKRGLSL